MNRFLLFRYEDYEPSGGWHDLAGAYKTIQAAKAAHNRKRKKDLRSNFHIVDIKTAKFVAGNDIWEGINN